MQRPQRSPIDRSSKTSYFLMLSGANFLCLMMEPWHTPPISVWFLGMVALSLLALGIYSASALVSEALLLFAFPAACFVISSFYEHQLSNTQYPGSGKLWLELIRAGSLVTYFLLALLVKRKHRRTRQVSLRPISPKANASDNLQAINARNARRTILLYLAGTSAFVFTIALPIASPATVYTTYWKHTPDYAYILVTAFALALSTGVMVMLVGPTLKKRFHPPRSKRQQNIRATIFLLAAAVGAFAIYVLETDT